MNANEREWLNPSNSMGLEIAFIEAMVRPMEVADVNAGADADDE
jgi:hypothetical protein